MPNRITTILGAGAVLDFDFHSNFVPTTWKITQKLLELKVQGLDTDYVNLIYDIYQCLYNNEQETYLATYPEIRHFEPSINFEELFDAIETLASYNTSWMNEGLQYPMISSLVSPKVHYQSIEYRRALEAMIGKITSIINDYNSYFVQNVTTELWYRNFWKNFNGMNDVFTFNYDTTIENSLEGNYNDGFIPFMPLYDRFSPKRLINNNDGVTTVNHMHGCILYADANPLIGQYEYSHRDLFKFRTYKDAFLSRQCMPTNQANEHYIYSPIITGLKKTDKICYLPHSYYHSNLSIKLLDNPSLLVIGYSFGDIYANQLIERHKLIHRDKQRMIIIDKYPNYVNDGWSTLSHFIYHHTNNKFKDLLYRQLEGIYSHNTIKNNIHHICMNVWKSKNDRLLIFTGGFKDAVMNHADYIMQFLKQ